MRLAIMMLMTLVIFAAGCGKHGLQTTNTPQEPTDKKGFTTPLEYAGYNLVWKEEFDQTIPDEASWTFETGNGGNGWGNNELEYYTAENASIIDGGLVITAKKEQKEGFGYTSSRMITKGKKSFLYGRIDIRAKLPEGQGVWPALWMLGSNIDSVGWPQCGEIDIMEQLGHEPGKSYGTLHWGPDWTQHHSKGESTILASGKLSDEFHVYSMLWEKDSLSIMLDNKTFFSLSKSEVDPEAYPFNAPHYFIFNVAVGGNWPGAPDASTVFPQQMVVDYLRVFQRK